MKRLKPSDDSTTSKGEPSRFSFNKLLDGVSKTTVIALLVGCLLGYQLSYASKTLGSFTPCLDTLAKGTTAKGTHKIEILPSNATSLRGAWSEIIDVTNDPTDIPMHWCLIAKQYVTRTTNHYFEHFPHAAETILPCWSWFRQQHATKRCGFVLTRGFSLRNNSWQEQLINAMGCKVKNMQNDSVPPIYVGDGPKHLRSLPKDDIQHIPNAFLQKPRFPMIRYLAEEEDAHALRRLFITDEEIARVKGNGKPLQIGLLQRSGARHITNLKDIEAALIKALPGCQTNFTMFQFPNLKDQAEWFANKDVIVGAHGAGLANSIFVTKGTIVMQIWPENWFWQSLDPLIEQSGGIAIDWYRKGTHPVVAYEKAKLENLANTGNMASITPPVAEVVDRILLALGKLPAVTQRLDELRDRRQWR
mmetsp:Transcript_13503/g.19079  ORF Transcript_13503/g.19079 Transcript_13503/m.19079 type:complete len:418 (+) Transcript_13503:64-1317(+)